MLEALETPVTLQNESHSKMMSRNANRRVRCCPLDDIMVAVEMWKYRIVRQPV